MTPANSFAHHTRRVSAPSASTDGHAGPRAEATGRRLAVLSLVALGIVYGDIGTSPLYALRECFHGHYGIATSAENILGVLSLMLWALVLVVSVKYLTFIMRADNHGEGGALALTSLVASHFDVAGRRTLVALGLFAAALLYGDGMITPAISVLSAVEGLSFMAPSLETWVIPATIVILLALFFFQRHGTATVGSFFGPVTFVWFLVLGATGIHSILENPAVLAALNPVHGLAFIAREGYTGFLVLGSVFLVVTGAEALYADMGHFGRRPIRLTWFAVVFPGLLLNYFGQGALLLRRPEAAHQPFYSLMPSALLVPVVVLATAATIIASQAVISGAFSLTRQAIQLGYLPRLRIVHTSHEEIGQIYVPEVNWALMLTTIALVLGFRSSSGLAAAYGVAVTATMTISTMLFFIVATRRWHWPLWALIPLCALFLAVDLAFFGANIVKVEHGGWFPLVVGAITYALMSTWKVGRRVLASRMRAESRPVDGFLQEVSSQQPVRVPGTAVYMSGNPHGVPPALVYNYRHNHVLHERILFLTVTTEERPRVARDERVSIEDLGLGFYRVIARFGFMETPNVPWVLALVREKGLDIHLEETSFVLGRERLVPRRRGGMAGWRVRLFAFMSRNAQGATDFFRIPPEQVIEVGVQVEL